MGPLGTAFCSQVQADDGQDRCETHTPLGMPFHISLLPAIFFKEDINYPRQLQTGCIQVGVVVIATHRPPALC